MNETKDEIDYASAGWGFLTLLLLAAWVTTIILQFFGGAWYWPWIFFGGMVMIVVRQLKIQKDAE